MSSMKDNTPPNTPKRDNDQKKLKEVVKDDKNIEVINDVLIKKADNTALTNKKSSTHTKSYGKKIISPGRIRKHKTSTPSIKTNLKSKKKDVSGSGVSESSKGSFYQGAIFGSFLGAAVTTVLSNLAVKAFQN